MVVIEPPIITLARETAQLEDGRGRTVSVPRGAYRVWRELGVRPELLSESALGRNYRLTAKQARKIMAAWDGGLREQWEAHHATRG